MESVLLGGLVEVGGLGAFCQSLMAVARAVYWQLGFGFLAVVALKG